MPANEREGVLHAQPQTADERAQLAETCAVRLHLELPMLLDSMDNSVDALYAAWPERLYLVDAAGVIAYRGEPGPWGFDVDGWARAVQAQQVAPPCR